MSIFSHLYNLTDDIKKKAKEPIIKNRLKRKLQAAYDNLASAALNEIEKIDNAYNMVEHIDIQTVIKAKAEIENIKATAKMIKEEYQLLFGEVMATESISEWELPKLPATKKE